MNTKQERIREEIIRQIREIGESLIKNAESIAGSESMFAGLELNIYINPEEGLPEICIDRVFYPEKTIERKLGSSIEKMN